MHNSHLSWPQTTLLFLSYARLFSVDSCTYSISWDECRVFLSFSHYNPENWVQQQVFLSYFLHCMPLETMAAFQVNNSTWIHFAVAVVVSFLILPRLLCVTASISIVQSYFHGFMILWHESTEDEWNFFCSIVNAHRETLRHLCKGWKLRKEFLNSFIKLKVKFYLKFLSECHYSNSPHKTKIFHSHCCYYFQHCSPSSCGNSNSIFPPL